MMKAVDITRLKQAAQFLEDGEEFIVRYGNLEIALKQSKSWLHIGMCWTDVGYRWGRNLDNEMRQDDNIEYWIMHVIRHMDKRRKEDDYNQE